MGGDVCDRRRWRMKGAKRMWLVLGAPEHGKFAFGKHCAVEKTEDGASPMVFSGTATGCAGRPFVKRSPRIISHDRKESI